MGYTNVDGKKSSNKTRRLPEAIIIGAEKCGTGEMILNVNWPSWVKLKV